MCAKRITILILFISTIFFSYSPCFGAQEAEDGQVSMTIPSVTKISVTNHNIFVDLRHGSDAFDAYTAGYVIAKEDKPKVTASSNLPWKLSARVSTKWNPIQGYQKEVSDLHMIAVDTSGFGHQTGFFDYAPLTLDDQEIGSASGSGIKNQRYECEFKILLDWEKDVPGEYSVIVTFTLATLG